MDRRLLKSVVLGSFLLSTWGVYASAPDGETQAEDAQIAQDEAPKPRESVRILYGPSGPSKTYEPGRSESVGIILWRLKLLEEILPYLSPEELENAEALRGKSPHNPTVLKAIENLDGRTLKAFIAQGLDINAYDSGGETLLFRLAYSFGFSDDQALPVIRQLKLLLKNGADPDLPNAWGVTPLYVTLCRRERRRARQLLDHGADPNAQKGCKLLHNAIDKEFFEFVPLLLEYDADANARDEHGRTPLDIALQKRTKISDDDWNCEDKRKGYNQAIKFLLKYGAIESQPKDKIKDQSQENSEDENEIEDEEKNEDSRIADKAEDGEN
jgi:ankyrin repeat protein